MTATRRRASAPLAIAIATVIAIPILFGMSPRAAAGTLIYFDDCQDHVYGQNVTVIERVEATADVSGALADVDMRVLHPCTLNGSFADDTGIAISIQRSATDKTRIVQIGYTRCSGICPAGIPADGENHFWYTNSDTGSGNAHGVGWYTNPIVYQDRYRLKVEATTHSGANVWQFCIKDTTAGESYSCGYVDRSWTYGYCRLVGH